MEETRKISNPAVYLFAKMWDFSRGNQRNVVLYITLSIIANISSLLNPLVIAKILDTIQLGGISRDTMWYSVSLVGLLILLQIFFWAFHGPSRVLERTNAFLVRANYKRYLLAGVMDLPTEWHTDHHSGDTIDKVEKGTRALYDFAENFFQIISKVVSLVGSYAFLIYFNVHSAYIVLFSVIITGLIIINYDRKLVKDYHKLNQAENKISEKIYDAISNITTVIILRVERPIMRAVNKYLMEPFGLYIKNSKMNELKWFLVSLATSAMIFLVIASHIVSVVLAGGTVLVGTIYALYGYVQNINETFFQFAWQYSEIVRQRTAVANAELVSSEFRRKPKAKPVSMKDWGELDIKDLTFSYNIQEGSNLHIDGISMRLRKGERVAVIGESGSGKSTFLKLLRDLYHPSRVTVALDGIELPNGFNSISEEIALIPQDPEIFATTIMENITLGVGYDMEVVKKHTDMACFTSVAEKLPRGFDSSVVEKGVNLSGGEKQRLALSRGLLACEDKAIVLLDEPTSSVDSHNERNIYQNIFSAFTDKTIISSIHRLHLLPSFDSIYLFREGKIVASGTFEEMLANSEYFRDIWEKYNRSKQGAED